MTNDNIREALSDYFAGDEETLNEIVLFENPDYADAVVGISHDNRPIYSYAKMVEHLMRVDDITEEEAIDFIDTNTMRSLPYAAAYGAHPPIILFDLFI